MVEVGLRLGQVVQDGRLSSERGAITEICRHTHIERHKVSALLRNNVRSVSLEDLSKICDYLIKEHHVAPQTLPGILFGREPGGFLSVLTERRMVDVCLGVRIDVIELEKPWVQAADSYVMFNLGHLITGHGAADDPARRRPKKPLFGQHMVPTYPRNHHTPEGKQVVQAAKRKARELYRNFREGRSNRALVCLGSQKSNPVFELVVARAFKCTPFEEDTAEDVARRRCPFFFAYRKRDVKPPSCAGGTRLPGASRRQLEPGIHYELEDGTWTHVPHGKTRDVALIFYVYNAATGRFEVVLSGYSGPSTYALDHVLRNLPHELWPPTYSRNGIQYGAFIAKLEYAERKGTVSPDAFFADPKSIEVERLSPEVFKRRLEPKRTPVEEAPASKKNTKSTKSRKRVRRR